MGGCRCTYRNCTVRTDGKTHMFHYPVFDKVRCHQWLTNARRLEFLDLKVSQLKNRVVCQHHFKDDNFMNFKRDKLTFDAVPTEDGPFCNTVIEPETKPEPPVESITVDDIENDFIYTLSDKLANFSVKYSDFLTNIDLPDERITENVSKNTSNNEYDIMSMRGTNNVVLLNKPSKTDLNRSNSMQIARVAPQCIDLQNTNPSSQVLYNDSDKNISQDKNVVLDVICFEGAKQAEKESKVKILSEVKVSHPPIIPKGKLKPVSPSLLLNLPKNKKQTTEEVPNVINYGDGNFIVTFENPPIQTEPVLEVPLDKPKVVDLTPNEIEPIKQKKVQVHIPQKGKKVSLLHPVKPEKYETKIVSKPMVEMTNVSIAKNKIPPERIAAIKEKRKFNMKLRDIIETCLEGLDEKDRFKEKDIQGKKEEKVGPHLAKHNTLPSEQQYNTISYLETRLKQMEEALLNKIGQNTQKIGELKETMKDTVCHNKKTVSTQTTVSEQLHKKYLFQEISKYMSPEVNSIIYEELFINKYSQNSKDSPTPKRRKRR